MDDFPQIVLTRKKVRNMSLRLKSDGKLYLTAPNFVSDRQIQKFITTHHDWILAQQKKLASRPVVEIYSQDDLKTEANQLAEYWAEQMHVEYDRIRFRSMTSRWGVCNTKTRIITLNTELTKYPKECLEYVIVHELAHILVSAHNQEFWSIVGENLPNYKVLRKMLRGA